MSKITQLYGTWGSPVSSEMVAHQARLGDVAWDSDGTTLVWTESRAGSTYLMASSAGEDAPRYLTDGDIPIRGGVGYGGGDFTVARGSVFLIGKEKRLYRLALEGGLPQPLTPAFGAAAAPRVSPDGRFVVFVHEVDGDDCLAVVDVQGKQFPRKLVSGDEFYMQPAWHPHGEWFAYIAWNHPQMPFDGTVLRLARLGEAAGLPMIAQQQTIAGGTNTAIFQPEFSPDGTTLAYVSDETGWWHLYLYDLATGTHTQITDGEAEHGVPAWVQGLRTYAWSHDGSALYFLRNVMGKFSVWVLDRATKVLRVIEALAHYTYFRQLSASPTSPTLAVFAASATLPERLITLEVDRLRAPDIAPAEPDTGAGSLVVISGEQERIRTRSRAEMLSPFLADGEQVTWTGHDGEVVHGWYYAPTSERYTAQGAPPLIVHVHGGPTSQARLAFDAEIQYYVTRGYAWLDVNHRGSTGFGKAYKDKLQGGWGFYDVEDAASGALSMAEAGRADRSRLIIMGGSAGGYTVLQSLTNKPGIYAAGVCLYGIGNLFTLGMNTDWKFEMRYNDTLIGVLPDAMDVMRARSPLFHADKIRDPLIIFHGEKDEAVLIDQAEGIVKVLRRMGTIHEYHTYKGEGHGWRKSETVAHYLAATIKFLQQHVIFR